MNQKFSPQEIGEIQADWRRNANLKDSERLDLVAQLHDCTPDDISGVLHLADREAKAELTRGIRSKHIRKRVDPETRKAAVKDVLLEGMTQTAVAEKYGVAANTVCAWVQEARKTQQEFLSCPEPTEAPAKSPNSLTSRANQLYSAVEGAQCLWDEAYHYRALSPSDLDALADIIDRMRHFQLGFEAGLAAARGETEAGSRREAAQSPVPRDNWDSFPG